MTGNGRELGGSVALGPWRVRRAGYGAMQLAGDGIFGPPRDRDEALRVLRAAVAAGVDHIDTAQYYGAGTVNELIREALYPYPDGLAIVSKVAARRDAGGAVLRSDEPHELRQGIEDNLATLGADRLAAVNLRVMDPSETPGSGFDAQLAPLVAAREKGLIDGIGSATSPSGTCCQRSPRRRSSVCRTCSTWPTSGPGTSWSSAGRGTSRSCRSARWAGPARCGAGCSPSRGRLAAVGPHRTDITYACRKALPVGRQVRRQTRRRHRSCPSLPGQPRADAPGA